MMTQNFTFRAASEPLTKDGKLIAQPDRLYPVDGVYVAFDELVLHGNFGGAVEYRGKQLTWLYAHEQIGMLVDQNGPRGPVLRGALFQVTG